MNKKKLKRREEKEKIQKLYKKRKYRKKLGRMVAPIHFDPKILPKESATLRWVGKGQGTSYFIACVVPWKEKALDVGGQSSIDFAYFWGSNNKQ